MYFVSLFFLLLTVYNTRLTIDLSCVLNHAVKYFPSFVGKLLLAYLCVLLLAYLEGSDHFFIPLKETIQQVHAVEAGYRGFL